MDLELLSLHDTHEESLESKRRTMVALGRLVEAITDLKKVVVAFSGGVDSSLLAVLSTKVLGRDNALVVTSVSASLAREERARAEEFAGNWGLNFQEVATGEFEDERYLRNDSLRCFYCKSSLMDALSPLALERDAKVVLGVNLDDLSDYRPGQEAAKRQGGVFPFVQAAITKDEVREISRILGIEVWNKPAAPCLSSRLPYGTPVTVESLEKIEFAEAILRGYGFEINRVRHFGDRAKVEVPLAEIQRLMDVLDEIESEFMKLGYSNLSVDPRGFRSGNLNDALLVKGSD
ncbi:MAG: ATP-dependent sacrificial sulfur transferase LarE [Acidimicrobiaceae bacterium]|nr:ATP-dependent sacrificial sulfur transferase LarE [Acidimicrobiaceae bacterium]